MEGAEEVAAVLEELASALGARLQRDPAPVRAADARAQWQLLDAERRRARAGFLAARLGTSALRRAAQRWLRGAVRSRPKAPAKSAGPAPRAEAAWAHGLPAASAKLARYAAAALLVRDACAAAGAPRSDAEAEELLAFVASGALSFAHVAKYFHPLRLPAVAALGDAPPPDVAGVLLRRQYAAAATQIAVVSLDASPPLVAALLARLANLLHRDTRPAGAFPLLYVLDAFLAGAAAPADGTATPADAARARWRAVAAAPRTPDLLSALLDACRGRSSLPLPQCSLLLRVALHIARDGALGPGWPREKLAAQLAAAQASRRGLGRAGNPPAPPLAAFGAAALLLQSVLGEFAADASASFASLDALLAGDTPLPRPSSPVPTSTSPSSSASSFASSASSLSVSSSARHGDAPSAREHAGPPPARHTGLAASGEGGSAGNYNNNSNSSNTTTATTTNNNHSSSSSSSSNNNSSSTRNTLSATSSSATGDFAESVLLNSRVALCVGRGDPLETVLDMLLDSFRSSIVDLYRGDALFAAWAVHVAALAMLQSLFSNSVADLVAQRVESNAADTGSLMLLAGMFIDARCGGGFNPPELPERPLWSVLTNAVTRRAVDASLSAPLAAVATLRAVLFALRLFVSSSCEPVAWQRITEMLRHEELVVRDDAVSAFMRPFKLAPLYCRVTVATAGAAATAGLRELCKLALGLGVASPKLQELASFTIQLMLNGYGEMRGSIVDDDAWALSDAAIHIEATALVLLCSGASQLRRVGLELLRDAQQWTRGGEDSGLFSALEGAVREFLEQYARDMTFHKWAPVAPGTTLRSVCESDAPADRFIWIYCFGKFLPLLSQLSPLTYNVVYPVVARRVQALALDQSFGGKLQRRISSGDGSADDGWFRHALFCVASASEEQAVRHERLLEEILAAAHTIVRKQLAHADEALCVLQMASPDLFTILLKTLRKHERRRLRGGGGGAKMSDNFRVALSHLYGFLSEHAHPEMFVLCSRLREQCVDWLQVNLQFFASHDPPPDEHLLLRFHFCVLMTNASRKLAMVRSDGLPAGLRQRLFEAAVPWCRGPGYLDDERGQLYLQSGVARIHVAESRRAYEKALRHQLVVLQQAASVAVAHIAGGGLIWNDAGCDAVLAWANATLDPAQPRRRLYAVARLGLEGLLTANLLTSPSLVAKAVRGSLAAAEAHGSAYFLALAWAAEVAAAEHDGGPAVGAAAVATALRPVQDELLIACLMRLSHVSLPLRRAAFRLFAVVAGLPAQPLSHGGRLVAALDIEVALRMVVLASRRLYIRLPGLLAIAARSCLDDSARDAGPLLRFLVPFVREAFLHGRLTGAAASLVLDQLALLTVVVRAKCWPELVALWDAAVAEGGAPADSVVDKMLTWMALPESCAAVLSACYSLVNAICGRHGPALVNAVLCELSWNLRGLDDVHPTADGLGALAEALECEPPYQPLPRRCALLVLLNAALLRRPQSLSPPHAACVLHHAFLGLRSNLAVVRACSAEVAAFVLRATTAAAMLADEPQLDMIEAGDKQPCGLGSEAASVLVSALSAALMRSGPLGISSGTLEALTSDVAHVLASCDAGVAVLEVWITESLTWALEFPSVDAAVASLELLAALLLHSPGKVLAAPSPRLLDLVGRLRKLAAAEPQRLSSAARAVTRVYMWVVRHHGAPWQFPKLFYFSAALLWSTEDGVVADAAALLASVVAHERFGEAAASIASIDGLQLRDAATTALVDRIAAALARPRVRCVASTLVLELLAARGLWHSPEMAPALLLLFVPLLCGNLLPAPAVEQRRAVSENLVTAAAMDAAVLKRLWRVAADDTAPGAFRGKAARLLMSLSPPPPWFAVHLVRCAAGDLPAFGPVLAGFAPLLSKEDLAGPGTGRAWSDIRAQLSGDGFWSVGADDAVLLARHADAALTADRVAGESGGASNGTAVALDDLLNGVHTQVPPASTFEEDLLESSVGVDVFAAELLAARRSSSSGGGSGSGGAGGGTLRGSSGGGSGVRPPQRRGSRDSQASDASGDVVVRTTSQDEVTMRPRPGPPSPYPPDVIRTPAFLYSSGPVDPFDAFFAGLE